MLLIVLLLILSTGLGEVEEVIVIGVGIAGLSASKVLT